MSRQIDGADLERQGRLDWMFANKIYVIQTRNGGLELPENWLLEQRTLMTALQIRPYETDPALQVARRMDCQTSHHPRPEDLTEADSIIQLYQRQQLENNGPERGGSGNAGAATGGTTATAAATTGTKKSHRWTLRVKEAPTLPRRPRDRAHGLLRSNGLSSGPRTAAVAQSGGATARPVGQRRRAARYVLWDLPEQRSHRTDRGDSLRRARLPRLLDLLYRRSPSGFRVIGEPSFAPAHSWCGDLRISPRADRVRRLRGGGDGWRDAHLGRDKEAAKDRDQGLRPGGLDRWRDPPRCCRDGDRRNRLLSDVTSPRSLGPDRHRHRRHLGLASQSSRAPRAGRSCESAVKTYR